MHSPRRFRVGGPNIVHQCIDGEIVIVHLTTGCYFSLRGLGAAIWACLDQGESDFEIRERLAGRFAVPADLLDDDLQKFLLQLQDENLIRFEDRPAPAFVPLLDIPGEYAGPLLEKFSDMADLLLLDPIHEVDEIGWPHPRPQAA